MHTAHKTPAHTRPTLPSVHPSHASACSVQKSEQIGNGDPSLSPLPVTFPPTRDLVPQSGSLDRLLNCRSAVPADSILPLQSPRKRKPPPAPFSPWLVGILVTRAQISGDKRGGFKGRSPASASPRGAGWQPGESLWQRSEKEGGSWEGKGSKEPKQAKIRSSRLVNSNYAHLAREHNPTERGLGRALGEPKEARQDPNSGSLLRKGQAGGFRA